MRWIFIQVDGEEGKEEWGWLPPASSITRERTKCVFCGSEVELGTKNCVSAGYREDPGRVELP